MEVQDKVSEIRKFIKGLDRRRVKFICHHLRHNESMTNIIEGKNTV